MEKAHFADEQLSHALVCSHAMQHCAPCAVM
jgi:hypothetical protein